MHSFEPPPPIKQRDTWKIAKGAFKLRSNRLLDVAMTLGLREQKHQKSRDEWPGWWLRANGGDAKAIAEMSEYCKQDVRTLEELYLKIRPYDIQQHPRFYSFNRSDRAVCGYCGSEVQYRGKTFVGQKQYQRYVCLACGRWDRERKACTP